MGPAAGIVLAGGRSARMGSAKATLEWHGSTLLRRVAGMVARAVDGPVVVVRAPGQALPSLPAGIGVVDDPHEGLGPLQGMAAGMTAVSDEAATAFVASTDLPLLHHVFIARVLAEIVGPWEVAAPRARGQIQPLAAAYRVDVRARIEELLATGSRRVTALLDACAVRELPPQWLLADARLATVDPDLDSLVNVNDPAGYRAARARPAPRVTVRGLDGRAHHAVPAATLAAAAAATRAHLDGTVATLNGQPVHADGHTPLASGDTVAFHLPDARSTRSRSVTTP